MMLDVRSSPCINPPQRPLSPPACELLQSALHSCSSPSSDPDRLSGGLRRELPGFGGGLSVARFCTRSGYRPAERRRVADDQESISSRLSLLNLWIRYL